VDFLDGLLDALGAAIDDIIAFLQWLLQELVAIFTYMWDVFAGSDNYLYGQNFYGESIFKTIWNSIIKKILLDIVLVLTKIHDWLEDHLGPIVDFLKKARAWFDRIFKQYIKPFLQLLQFVRKFLEILRLFGVKWAAKLDAVLAKVQADVMNVFLQVKAFLNGIIDILNILTDPLGLLRKPTIVLSMRRTFLSMVRVVTGRPPGWYFPSPVKGAAVGLGPVAGNTKFTNPLTNPPGSSFLGGDDGLGGFSGFTSGQVPDDGAVDDIDPLDYFNEDLWPAPTCTDAATCLAALQSQAYQSISSPSTT